MCELGRWPKRRAAQGLLDQSEDCRRHRSWPRNEGGLFTDFCTWSVITRRL